MDIRDFMNSYFRHFNARTTLEAAKGWLTFESTGGKMFVTIGGAMSTAGLGAAGLAQLIRDGRIAGISTTGANLEEDFLRVIAKSGDYREELHYPMYGIKEDTSLFHEDRVRITDVSLPKDLLDRCWELLVPHLIDAIKTKKKLFPAEIFYSALRDLGGHYPDSWVHAAMEKNLFVVTPGFEDSSMGNALVTEYKMGRLSSMDMIKSGFEQFHDLIDWYQKTTIKNELGIFQIGGGIAGDFPICVVPALIDDMGESPKKWGYFCQISDSTESYGSYSGAKPTEKITWKKLHGDSLMYKIESDATIVAPLIFQYLLET